MEVLDSNEAVTVPEALAYDGISHAHIAELQAVVKQIVRAELKEIFALDNLMAGQSETAEASILNTISRISKVHEENALGNAVDKALRNAFDVHKAVYEYERKHIEEVCRVQLDTFRANDLVRFKQAIANSINSIPVYY